MHSTALIGPCFAGKVIKCSEEEEQNAERQGQGTKHAVLEGEFWPKFSHGDGFEMAGVRIKHRKKGECRGKEKKSEGTHCLL